MPDTTPGNRRRDYRHFPASYSELLHRFNDAGGVAEVGPLTERAAKAARRDLYRFKTFLSKAVDDDPSDAFARELHDIACKAILTVEPLVVATPHGTHALVLRLNPITAWVEKEVTQ